jgi:hypothetical protein
LGVKKVLAEYGDAIGVRTFYHRPHLPLKPQLPQTNKGIRVLQQRLDRPLRRLL